MRKLSSLFLSAFLVVSSFSFAREGTVTVNPKRGKLLASLVKLEIAKAESDVRETESTLRSLREAVKESKEVNNHFYLKLVPDVAALVLGAYLMEAGSLHGEPYARYALKMTGALAVAGGTIDGGRRVFYVLTQSEFERLERQANVLEAQVAERKRFITEAKTALVDSNQ